MALLGFTFQFSPVERAKSRLLLSSSTRVRVFFFNLQVFSLALVFLGFGPAQGQTDESKEYQLKAAFLYHFAQFVKWPSDSFNNPDAPFCIGILGDDPFGEALEETVQGETIDNHKLVVERAHNCDDLKDCQIIFICKSEEGHVPQILSQLDSKPVLTVSETDSFDEIGGIINFYLQGGKVRFEINPSSAQRRGLKISSQLLNLGKIVETAKGVN